ncbi:S8 family serine peptidase [Calorimonas adulescens]|nr:S8 family serine peptidase [Calorimonas adulescens]
MKKWLSILLIGLLVLGFSAPVIGATNGDLKPVEKPENITEWKVTDKGDLEKEAKLPDISDKDKNKMADDLDDKLSEAKNDEEIPVIAILEKEPTEDIIDSIEGQIGKFKLNKKWGKAVDGFSALMTQEQINILSKMDEVKRIDYDREVTAFLDTATVWTGVQQARRDFGVDGDRDGNSAVYSKNDVVVAVIDTGIDTGHVDLDEGKVIGWRDEVNGKSTPYDDNGHGTHVSSIIAGTGEGNSAYRGVAPGVALVGIKVLDSRGSGTTSDIISGIDWMIANKDTYNIRIGNMSLGATGSSDGTDSLSLAVNRAVDNGIIMCVAAGNEGPARYTIGSPAAAAKAITVGASYDPGEKGWVLAEFSSRGPTADGRTKPDIITPGRNITAAKAGSKDGYVTYSGTSMATPFMAGVLALMLDANYSLNDSAVKNILYSDTNLKDFGPSGKDIDFGSGINISYNAVKSAGGFNGSFSDGLVFDYGEATLTGTGDTDWWEFNVTESSKPIGITFVIPNHTSSIDFDIYLYDPNGKQVAASEGTKRQEQILFTPSTAGTYRLKVYSYKGSGGYWFNVSYK